MLDLLRILLKWYRPIVVMVLLAAIVAAGVSLRLTPRYYSQASILPPNDDPGFGGLSSLLQQYQIPIPGGTKTPFLPTLYASILSSRKMGKRILDEFELRPEFKTSTEQDALGVLRGRTFLRYTDEGILLVGYEDPSPKRAADVVNAYVRHLDEFIQQVNAGRAGQTRTFIDGQIAHCSKDLADAEDRLKEFQTEHRAVQIDTQTQGALEIAGDLQGRILAAEVELGILRQHALPSAPELQAKKAELEQLQTTYGQLVGQNATLRRVSRPAEPGAPTLFPTIDAVPDLALQFVRLLRDVKVQETLYTMLLQQLEQARLEEQKNTPVLSVLDSGEPAETPSYPRKTRLVLLAALAALVWVAIVAIVVEKLRERRADAAEAAQLLALRQQWDRMPGWVRSLERLVVK